MALKNLNKLSCWFIYFNPNLHIEMPNRKAYYEQLKKLYEEIKAVKEIQAPTVVIDNIDRITISFISFPIPPEESSIEEIRGVFEEYKKFHRLLIDVKIKLESIGRAMFLPAELMDNIIKNVEERKNILNIYLEDGEKKVEQKRSKWRFHFEWLSILVAIIIFVVGFLVGRHT